MKKQLLILFLFIGFAVSSTAQKVSLLNELERPTAMRFAGDHIYLVEDSGVIRVFSIKTGTIVKNFGKKGTGPGEFSSTPYLKVLENVLSIASPGKISYFTFDGLLQSEKKVPVQIWRNILEPAGNNFVGMKWGQLPEKGKMKIVQTVNLYNKEFKLQKELYSCILAVEGQEINLVPPTISFLCDMDRIYVAEGDKGLAIQVFDTNGKLLTRIDRPYEKIKIDEKYKNQKLQSLKEADEGMFNAMKSYYRFPKYFPAIQSFFVDRERIWVKTYALNDERVEFLLLNLKGEELKRVFLPEAKNNCLFVGDTYHYLREDMNKEIWEHVSMPIFEKPKIDAFTRSPKKGEAILKKNGTPKKED